MKAAFKAVIAVAAATLCTACAHRQLVKSAPTPVATTTAAVDANAEPSLRGSTMHMVPELKTVHFDYDKAFLKASDRAILASNAQWLMQHDDLRVQVAGYCDQRGTVEYNIALGQRRASAVREYYRHLGVAANRIATISYGEENPVCNQANEACWSQNRRAETLVASPNVANAR